MTSTTPLPLSVALREILIQVAAYEAANASRGDVAAKVFDYIATGGFAQRISSMIEVIVEQRSDSAKGQRAMQQFWRAEDTRLRSLEAELASMVGDLLGLGATLPEKARFDHVAAPAEVPATGVVLTPSRRIALQRVPPQGQVKPSA
ncbi:MAG TPA: hypothetical protein VME20_00675 [Acidimicrobiales bacterium]|nr:hypothetical protein [Acidimicrobiales bacterium]